MLTSKQRAKLMSLASETEAILNLGKEGVTRDFTAAALQALEARELIKVSVLKTCDADLREIGEVLADETGAELVKVIGRKVILFKQNKNPKKRVINI